MGVAVRRGTRDDGPKRDDPESGWRPSRRRAGVAAGLTGSAAATLSLAILHTLAPAVPFIPVSLAQSLVRAAPGGFATFFIEHLGHWALRVATAGTCGAFVLSGTVLGLLLPDLVEGLGERRSFLAATAVLLPLWGASVALYPSDPQFLSRWPFALATLPLSVLAGAVAGAAYRRLTAEPAGRTGDLSRRVVLRSLWFGAFGVLLGLGDLGRLLHRRPNPGLQLLSLPKLTRATPPPPEPGDAAFARIHGLTQEITPNDRFYVVDEEIIDPDIDPATWRLSVGGLVDRPFELTYAELKALPAVERYQTLECISNRVGGHLMSTAKWVGVPLVLLLQRAGVRPGAVEVVFRAAGGYSDSLLVGKAMEETTLIAVGMNGHVLPREHGFPARLLSTGTYGMKNPKWLVGMEVVDRPYTGFWEARGWSKTALVKTGSRIDVPDGGVARAAVTVAGVAFAGDRGISMVEVSTDGGSTWSRAELKAALSTLTWRQWRYRWVPAPGGVGRILVRATDGQGVLQTPVEVPPHPDGASGYDAMTVRLEPTP